MSAKSSTLTWVQQHWSVLQFGFYHLHSEEYEPVFFYASFLNKYQRNNQAIPHPQTPEEQQRWLAYHLLYAESLNEDFEEDSSSAKKRTALRKNILDHAIKLAIDVRLKQIQQKERYFRTLKLPNSFAPVTLSSEKFDEKTKDYTLHTKESRKATNRIDLAMPGTVVGFVGAVIAIAIIALNIAVAPLVLFIIPALLIAAGIALSVLLARSFKKLNEAEQAIASIKKDLNSKEMISSIRTSINEKIFFNATTKPTRSTSLTTLSSLSPSSEESDKETLAQAKKAASLTWVQQHWPLLQYGFHEEKMPFGQDYLYKEDSSVEKQQKWLAYHYLYAKSLNQQFEIDSNFEENKKKLREYVSKIAAGKHNLAQLTSNPSSLPKLSSATLDAKVAEYKKFRQEEAKHAELIAGPAIAGAISIAVATIIIAAILLSSTTGLVILAVPAIIFVLGIALVELSIYSGYKSSQAEKKADTIMVTLTGNGPGAPLLSTVTNEILNAHKGSPTPAATTSTPAAVDGGAAVTSTTMNIIPKELNAPKTEASLALTPAPTPQTIF